MRVAVAAGLAQNWNWTGKRIPEKGCIWVSSLLLWGRTGNGVVQDQPKLCGTSRGHKTFRNYFTRGRRTLITLRGDH
ncbi:hypothetical protein AN958_00520 [Leucoagaricus sp. SymC.cos]|nr:hypothetical protein AN958_00520 [Leucoagaricus sp. SymC.cos]